MQFLEAVDYIQNNENSKVTNGDIILTWAIPYYFEEEAKIAEEEGEDIPELKSCLCLVKDEELVQIMPTTSYFNQEWNLV